MNRILQAAAFALVLSFVSFAQDASSADPGKHLFLLSGQSNMAGLRPEESFTPTVEQAFDGNVIIVKDALGGQPIRRWYKDWKVTGNQSPKQIGDLYARLMQKVKQATEDETIASVTFIWMQGERDAREKNADQYRQALGGVIDQLAADLNRDDINVVIGRLSDYDLENKWYPHWTSMREVQQAFVDAHPRAALVNTDDLNDGVNRRGKPIENDLHYSAEGYKTLGTRFANAAIELIKQGT